MLRVDVPLVFRTHVLTTRIFLLNRRKPCQSTICHVQTFLNNTASTLFYLYNFLNLKSCFYSVLHIVLHNEIQSAAFDVTDSHVPTHPWAASSALV
jgi:hypothetical protein